MDDKLLNFIISTKKLFPNLFLYIKKLSPFFVLINFSFKLFNNRQVFYGRWFRVNFIYKKMFRINISLSQQNHQKFNGEVISKNPLIKKKTNNSLGLEHWNKTEKRMDNKTIRKIK